jgi:glutamate synthase domain-containing protein 3
VHAGRCPPAFLQSTIHFQRTMARVIEIQINDDAHPARLQHILQDALANPSRLEQMTIQITEEEPDAIYAILQGGYGKDHLGVGLTNLLKVETMGSIGDYGFSGTSDCECVVQGNVGDYFGHSQISGTLLVMGSAGHGFAAMAEGGLSVVLGDSLDRPGASLRGAAVLVRGDVGAQAGYRMRSGILVIGGNAGPDLGAQFVGGRIYIRGQAQSMSPDIEECRLREPDRLILSLLLMKAGLKASTLKEFRVFRSPNEL